MGSNVQIISKDSLLDSLENEGNLYESLNRIRKIRVKIKIIKVIEWSWKKIICSIVGEFASWKFNEVQMFK